MLANLNGKEIFYQVYGQGEPLVLIHGLGVTHQMWKWQIEDLQKDYQVIVYDLPGHGESEYRLAKKKINHELATDLKCLLDHLQIEQATIAGLSLGGRVAIAFTSHYPDRVSKLILSSTVDRVQGFKERFRTWMGTKMIKGMELEKMVQASGRAFFPNPKDQQAQELFIQEARKVQKEAMVHLSPAVKENYQPYLKKFKVPTLVFVGEKETLMLEIAKRLASKIPSAKLEIIPGVGHIWNMEEPDLFNQKVREFLAS